MTTKRPKQKELPILEGIYCSFCGRHGQEVKRLVAGKQAFICDECVDLCVEMLAERKIQ